MVSFLAMVAVGLLICVFGIINMTGNISSLHAYHRHRVTEKDRKPFGRLVGIGTLIIGVTVILYGVSFLLYEKMQQDLYVTIGTFVLILGIVIGLAITFYAMKKYNKGIF